jgi:hypothetical protein
MLLSKKCCCFIKPKISASTQFVVLFLCVLLIHLCNKVFLEKDCILLVVIKFHPHETKIFSLAAVYRKVNLSCFLSHFRKGAVNSMKGERGAGVPQERSNDEGSVPAA